jgi:hypothetical protein
MRSSVLQIGSMSSGICGVIIIVFAYCAPLYAQTTSASCVDCACKPEDQGRACRRQGSTTYQACNAQNCSPCDGSINPVCNSAQ